MESIGTKPVFAHDPPPEPRLRSRLEIASGLRTQHRRLSVPWFRQRCHVDRARGCWEWMGNLDPAGYGRVKIKGRAALVHRLAYAAAQGAPIADAVMVLHSCDNPRCCNPAHLSVGDAKENARQMVARGRAKPGKGERHGMAKLNERAVRHIRESGEDEHALAKRYRVKVGAIRNVRLGRTWSHVKSTAQVTEAVAAAQARCAAVLSEMRARSKEMAAKRRKRSRGGR